MQHVKLHILRILQFQKISIYHKKTWLCQVRGAGVVQDKSWVLAFVRYLPMVWGPIVCPPARGLHPVEEHWTKSLDWTDGGISCIGMTVPHVQSLLESNRSWIITSKNFHFFQIPWLWHMFFPPKKLLEQTVNHSNHHKPWSPPLYWMIWLLCGYVPARPPQSPTAKTWVLVPRIVIFGHSMPEPTGAVPTNMKLIWLVLMQICTVHDVFETFWRS